MTLSYARTLFLISALLWGMHERASGQIFPNLGGQRVGISALTLLKNNLSPRSMAMGGADATITGDAYSIFTNPALPSELRTWQVGLSNLNYIGQLNHTAINGIIPVSAKSNLVVAMNNISAGPEKVRTEFQPDGNGQLFYNSLFVGGLGYSQSLSEKFSFGILGKVVNEQAADWRNTTLGVDIGFLYRTDFRGLRFGAAMQHFGNNSALSGGSRPVSLNSNGTPVTDYSMPTLFKMGASINAYEGAQGKLVASLQVDHPNDNAENIRMGLEYSIADELGRTFFLRTGYKINVLNETWPTAGLGFRLEAFHLPIQVDGSYYRNDLLGGFYGLGLCVGAPRKVAKPNPDVIHD